jgi:chitinase
MSGCEERANFWVRRCSMAESKKSGVRPLGQLLMEKDRIVPQDLEFALDHQKNSRDLIGQILVRMGALGETELDEVLIEQSHTSH